jgi:hypothetical protein
MSTVAVSPGISMEFSADRTLASSRCLSNLWDVVLLVMHQQYARSSTHGTMVVAPPVTLPCQWLSDSFHSAPFRSLSFEQQMVSL